VERGEENAGRTAKGSARRPCAATRKKRKTALAEASGKKKKREGNNPACLPLPGCGRATERGEREKKGRRTDLASPFERGSRELDDTTEGEEKKGHLLCRVPRKGEKGGKSKIQPRTLGRGSRHQTHIARRKKKKKNEGECPFARFDQEKGKKGEEREKRFGTHSHQAQATKSDQYHLIMKNLQQNCDFSLSRGGGGGEGTKGKKVSLVVGLFSAH